MRYKGVDKSIPKWIFEVLAKGSNVGRIRLLYTYDRLSLVMIALGVLFAIFGVLIKLEQDKVHSKTLEYQDCKNLANDEFSLPPERLRKNIVSWQWDGEVCKMRFIIKEDVQPPMYLYYELTNFYQNHRGYSSSFDRKQLKGKVITNPDDLDSQCDPLRRALDKRLKSIETTEKRDTIKYKGETYDIDQNAIIYPCGLKANSMFSDEIFGLECVKGACEGGYEFFEEGIVSKEGKQAYGTINWRKKFSTELEFSRKIIPPPIWRNSWSKWKDGYTFENYPRLGEWERFQVWMDPAVFSEFTKIFGKNDKNVLKRGVWEISIRETFNEKLFNGKKRIVITNGSVLGERNKVLIVAYFTSSVCLIASGLFILGRHTIFKGHFRAKNL